MTNFVIHYLMRSDISFVYLIEMFFDFRLFWFNIFCIELIDHIIKFNVFLEMQHLIKFENIKIFFFRFYIQEFVLAKNGFQNIYSKNTFFKQLHIKLLWIKYWVNKTKFIIILMEWTASDFFLWKEKLWLT